MSADVNNAAAVTPPVDVYVRATVGTSESLKLPTVFHENWITLQADSEDVYVNFTVGASGTADETATSSVTSNLPSPATNGVLHIPAGTERNYDLGLLKRSNVNDRIWLNHISPTGGNGHLRFHRSSGPKGA